MKAKRKVFHLDWDELSPNNDKIIKHIKSNTDIKLANRLLAQAYLFVHSNRVNFLDFSSEGLKFTCAYCKGCEGCKSADGYCSKYCMHANDCELAKFVEKLEKSFKDKIS